MMAFVIMAVTIKLSKTLKFTFSQLTVESILSSGLTDTCDIVHIDTCGINWESDLSF